jgi:hypothetical protein
MQEGFAQHPKNVVFVLTVFPFSDIRALYTWWVPWIFAEISHAGHSWVAASPVRGLAACPSGPQETAAASPRDIATEETANA